MGWDVADMATGPLTQATGPPRSCGGVAICMLRGNPLLTGYLMLYHALGSRTNRLFNVGRYLPSPYYRLINVLWLPFLKIKKFRVQSFKIRKFRVESCSCFLIETKFISKLLWILLMENESFSIPHLRKIWFTKYISKIYIKNI